MQRSCTRPYRYTKTEKKSQISQSSQRPSSYEVSVASSPLKLTLRSSMGIMRRARREGEDDKRDGLMIEGTLV